MFSSYFPSAYFPSSYFPTGQWSEPTWPGSLPQRPLQRGYTEKRQSLIARTQMDLGPHKVRLRQTASVTEFTMSFSLVESQLETLMQFWEITCRGGSVTFKWKHPRTQTDGMFRFVEPPMISPSQNRVGYDVALSMELLP